MAPKGDLNPHDRLGSADFKGWVRLIRVRINLNFDYIAPRYLPRKVCLRNP